MDTSSVTPSVPEPRPGGSPVPSPSGQPDQQGQAASERSAPASGGDDVAGRGSTAPQGADGTAGARQLPGTGADPSTAVPPGTAGTGTRAGSRSGWFRQLSPIRRVLVVLLAVVAVLCVSGLGVGYVLYDKATEPDRTTPTVAVDQYLEAALVDRDDSRASLYTCGRSADLQAIKGLREEIEGIEHRYDIHVSVGWENMQWNEERTRASVTADLKINVPEASGRSSRSIQHWAFQTEKHSGWRVCSAERLTG